MCYLFLHIMWQADQCVLRVHCSIYPSLLYPMKLYTVLCFNTFTDSLAIKFASIAVLKMKILIYWFESNSWIYFYIYIYLNKNWKMYWSEQSFNGLGQKDQCSPWGLSEICLFQFVPKTFWQTSLNSIFFYLIKQILCNFY